MTICKLCLKLLWDHQSTKCPSCGADLVGKRKSREEMFSDIVKIIAERSTCSRAKVGALAVRDNRIISIGYGGSPSGLPHCLDDGCEEGPDGGCTRTIHAEANVIAFAAKAGISLDGATLYVTLSPCYDCAKLIINSGIVEVVFAEFYRKTEGINLLGKAGIKIRRFYS